MDVAGHEWAVQVCRTYLLDADDEHFSNGTRQWVHLVPVLKHEALEHERKATTGIVLTEACNYRGIENAEDVKLPGQLFSKQ